jgi:hypothetical protein
MNKRSAEINFQFNKTQQRKGGYVKRAPKAMLPRADAWFSSTVAPVLLSKYPA